jgi:hypothetical protein
LMRKDDTGSPVTTLLVASGFAVSAAAKPNCG